MVHLRKSIVVISCPPYDSWWTLLPGDDPKIIQASSAVQQCYIAGSARVTKKYEVVGLEGWDKWERFSDRPLREISQHIRANFNHLLQSDHQAKGGLVLGRRHIPAHLPEQERIKYGSSKRDVPNLEEISASLNPTISTELVEPGLLSPLEIALRCRHTEVLISQHGAALAHAILLAPGITVIEISWTGFSESPYARIYDLLCTELGLNYRNIVAQQDCFSEADVELVVSAVKTTLVI